jgi:hypothetical protein
MGSINLGAISGDLDFLIAETKTELEGVTPSTISGKKFQTSIGVINGGFEVELNGREVQLDTEIILNQDLSEVAPTKGAVLKDAEGTKYKVFETEKEQVGSYLKLVAISQYAKD